MLMSYNMGQQRRLSGNVGVQLGEYYNGTIRSLTFSQRPLRDPQAVLGRAAHVDQSRRAADRRVHDAALSAPAPITASRPRMFASALLQYSSADHTFSSNVRFRWEYRPGSEFFVVWTDEQDTNPLEPQRGSIALRNRAFVVKMTRLFRF